ncbi:response regulator [Candidatus Nitrospira bockiana]
MSTSRILIIDDDPAVLTALPEMFRLWMPGTVVDLCGSARVALDKVEATDYDAIISDIRLPDMDGLLLLDEINTLRPHTPTLLITGYGDQTLAMQALRAGAYDYILKPVDRDYLLGAVQRAVHHRHVSRQAEECKRTESALRRSQESLHAVIESVPCLLVVTDADGRLLMFNRAAEEATGYGRAEVLGRSIFEVFVPPAAAVEVRERVRSLATADRRPHHTPWTAKNGEERLIEWRWSTMPQLDGQEPSVLGIGIDLTDQRRSEARITALNAELDQQVQAYAKVVRDLEASKVELQEKVRDLEAFQEMVVGRELKMITLEKQVDTLQRELAHFKGQARA